MTKYVCSICSGSGQTEAFLFEFEFEFESKDFKAIPQGKMKNCPGCDGHGVSVQAKILNGDMEKPKAFNITELCQAAIDSFPKEVILIKSGKNKAIGRLVKHVLDNSDNRAQPKEVNEMLTDMIGLINE